MSENDKLDKNLFDNKKLSNNKRQKYNLDNCILNNDMPQPKRKKSVSDDNIANPPSIPPSVNDPTLMNEINELKKIITEQKKKLNTLEKKTKDVFKKGSRLEDAVNDLYDIIEEWNDDYYDSDPDFDPKLISNIELSEFDVSDELIYIKNKKKKNRSRTTSSSKDKFKNNHIFESNINLDNNEENTNYIKNSERNTHNNLSNNNLSNNNLSNNESSINEVNNKDVNNKEVNNKEVNNNKEGKKKRKNRLQICNNNNKDITNELELELTPNDIQKIYSSNGEEYLQELIKDAIKKNKPEEYIEEYCKKKNINPEKTKELLNEYNTFTKLNKIINNKSDKKQSEIDIFIQNNPEKRKLIIQSMENLTNKIKNIDGYKFRILSSGMDTFVQQQALYKVKQLENTEVGTGEYYKLKNWLETLTTIPFNYYRNINVDNSVSTFLENSREKMNKVIYGQDNTKDIIIQIIAKMITNPGKCGNVFAIYGPPGVGKTTIIKEGMSKALGIPFAFLSLGGASDSSYLEGHGYTYEGSTPGKIVDILRKVECMNPIFYFDELDKISETRKGEEIANLLIHLTDPSQNSHFQDKYLGDINLDLSKSIFVFSFNDITKVNPILLDRMELIYVDGFTNEEKRIISRDYLLPELLETYNLYSSKKGRPNKNININSNSNSNSNKNPDINFTDENLDYIIKFNELNHLNMPKEDGVRSIKRRIEKICSNINIVKLTKGKWNNNIHSILDNCDELKNSKFPITLSNNIINKLLLSNNNNGIKDTIPISMYM